MRRNNQKWLRARTILWGVAGILLVMVIFVLATKASNNHSEAKDAAPKAEKTEKSQPAASVSSSSDAESSSQSSNIKELNSILIPAMDTAGEDSDTQTGGDVTYSCFYRKEGTWYWQLSSDNRKIVEVGEVRSVRSDGDKKFFDMTSRSAEPGVHYSLEFHWLNRARQQYQVHTDFEDINGNYTIGHWQKGGNGESKHTIMKQTLSSGEGKEDVSTRSNNGEITYSDFVPDTHNYWVWQLASRKRGVIEYARILSIKTANGLPTAITVEGLDDASKGDVYTLAINFDKNNMSYTLSTSHDNIQGEYNITVGRGEMQQ